MVCSVMGTGPTGMTKMLLAATRVANSAIKTMCLVLSDMGMEQILRKEIWQKGDAKGKDCQIKEEEYEVDYSFMINMPRENVPWKGF